MTCKRCDRRAKYRGLCAVHFNAVGHHGYVDAQPTRERIALLRSRGYSLRELAERVGVANHTLLCKYDKVQAATETAVMAVPIPPRGGTGHVNVIGPRRRLQALVAIGWPQSHIAEQLGIDPRELNRIIMTRKRVTGEKAAAIVKIYDFLWDKSGPSDAARRQANRKRWAPPMAWDDGAMDDPDAAPYGQRKRGVKPGTTRKYSTNFAERYQELRDMGETDDEVIAKRLGLTVNSLKQMRCRSGLSQSACERVS